MSKRLLNLISVLTLCVATTTLASCGSKKPLVVAAPPSPAPKVSVPQFLKTPPVLPEFVYPNKTPSE